VPFIANWKGTIAPAQVRSDLVDVSDLFATMLEAGRSTILNVHDGRIQPVSDADQGSRFAAEVDLHGLFIETGHRTQ
jgi:arylsulfatase A-like enzyme